VEVALDDAVVEGLEAHGDAESAAAQQPPSGVQTCVQLVQLVVDEYPQSLERLRGAVRRATELVSSYTAPTASSSPI